MLKFNVKDFNVNINEEQFCIRLIRSGRTCFEIFSDQHAQILIQGVRDQERFQEIWHFTTESGTKIPCKLPTPAVFDCINFIDPKIEIIDMTKKDVRANESSEIFFVSKERVEATKKSINEGVFDHKIKFNLFGPNLNVLYQMMTGIEAHNCLSMATRVLRHMGVILPKQFNVNLYRVLTTSKAIEYLNRHLDNTSIVNHAPSLEEICEYIKSDNIELLKTNVETVCQYVNKFISGNRPLGPTIGPKESFLGNYTLLAIAVIYGAENSVLFLIEECQDDVNFLLGRRRDHTVLDLAFSATGKDKADARENILKFLQKCNALTGKEQSQFLKRICVFIKKNKPTELKELIDDYRKKHNEIFSINQSVHIERWSFETFFLGVCSFLAVAIIYKKVEMVRILCQEYGADIESRFGRSSDYTALSYAKLLSHFSIHYIGSIEVKDIISFLEESGKNVDYNIVTDMLPISEAAGIDDDFHPTSQQASKYTLFGSNGSAFLKAPQIEKQGDKGKGKKKEKKQGSECSSESSSSSSGSSQCTQSLGFFA